MNDIELRDYQDDFTNDIRDAYKSGFKAPLGVLPTRAGKTVCFAYMADKASAKVKSVLILVHRIELLRQTSRTLQKFNVGHGLINPKFTPDYSQKIQVASVQTIINRLNKVPIDFDMIIIDEAHHAQASSWRKIIDYYTKAKLLGVTATPIRSDGAGLGVDEGGYFDCLIEGPSVKELIEKGWLTKPLVYAPLGDLDLSSVKIVAGDYDKKQIESIVNREEITGSCVEHYQKLCDGVPAVVFCISVKHAEAVAAEFSAAGYAAYSVDGSMQDDERSELINGLATGEVTILTTCDLVSEGTDLPNVGCAILLRPTKSLALFLQQTGRPLNVFPGKTNAIILDHVGNTLRHGMPDDEREWSLAGRKKGRRGANDFGDMVKTKQCSSCYAVHEPAPACPICGTVYEIKPQIEIPVENPGELQQLTISLKKKKKMEVGMCKTLEELIALGKERKYADNWAYTMWGLKKDKIKAKEKNPVEESFSHILAEKFGS